MTANILKEKKNDVTCEIRVKLHESVLVFRKDTLDV